MFKEILVNGQSKFRCTNNTKPMVYTIIDDDFTHEVICDNFIVKDLFDALINAYDEKKLNVIPNIIPFFRWHIKYFISYNLSMAQSVRTFENNKNYQKYKNQIPALTLL